MAVGESTRFGTLNKYVNFAGSLPMSGERTVIILTPFLLEENRRHGPERLRVSGRQLVWRMRYRNMLGAEKASLRIRPS
jgi:hypothetical protein